MKYQAPEPKPLPAFDLNITFKGHSEEAAKAYQRASDAVQGIHTRMMNLKSTTWKPGKP